MSLTRRKFVTTTLAAGATALLPTARHTAYAAPAAPRPAAPDPADATDFTFVHLTDMHVTPRRKGDRGYAACIASVRALQPRPAFALLGGDLAFDGLYTPKAEFEEQIRLFKEITAALGIPTYPCLGNHDVLGWSARRKVDRNDPALGKRFIMDRLDWEHSHYSFDHAGWHFSILDCIHPVQTEQGPSYEPRIGPEQLEWLAGDLGSAGDRPKICLTHIAAFCAMAQWNGDPTRKALDGSMVLWDTKELRLVLERHGVKALLQGHCHNREDYRFRDVWYLTSAAVSGAWWAGSWIGNPPGYTVFRCRGDELTWTAHTFAWEPQLEPEDELERARIAEQRAFEAEQHRLREHERRASSQTTTRVFSDL